MQSDYHDPEKEYKDGIWSNYSKLKTTVDERLRPPLALGMKAVPLGSASVILPEDAKMHKVTDGFYVPESSTQYTVRKYIDMQKEIDQLKERQKQNEVVEDVVVEDEGKENTPESKKPKIIKKGSLLISE
ncbi:MAG: hypothetical protein ABH869_06530, partial [Candidatus Omnitrophota bacterium]